jgi:hypothetical protein
LSFSLVMGGRVLEMLGSRGVSVKTVRPCVPRHRVTHLHPMPSRITRNSHRPRASDRTMVASEATRSLAALSNSMAPSPSAGKLTRMDNKPNFSREVILQWAGSRERNLASGRGEAFFLTSLFIERFELQSGVLSVIAILQQLISCQPRSVGVTQPFGDLWLICGITPVGKSRRGIPGTTHG